MSNTQDNLFWVDIETTGLRDIDEPLEVGAIVTDPDLVPIAAFHAFVDHDLDELRMSSWAWQTHTANGLLAELRARQEQHVVRTSSFNVDAGPFGKLHGLGVQEGLLSKYHIDEYLHAFINQYASGAPFAGSTVDFDRRVMAFHFSASVKLLHYRKVDVSTFREALRRWRPDLELPPKSERHRVFDDLAVSLETGRIARRVLLGDIPPTGVVEIPVVTTPDDMISEWHERTVPEGRARELHDFVGWTWQEYKYWVETNEPPLCAPDA